MSLLLLITVAVLITVVQAVMAIVAVVLFSVMMAYVTTGVAAT